MDHDERRKRIAELREKLNELVDGCTHNIVCCGKEGKKLQGWEWGECDVCGAHFDWWCPDSPDHTCYYGVCDDGNGTSGICLVDGEFISLDELRKLIGYSIKEDYWSECCMFCGEPNERK